MILITDYLEPLAWFAASASKLNEELDRLVGAHERMQAAVIRLERFI